MENGDVDPYDPQMERYAVQRINQTGVLPPEVRMKPFKVGPRAGDLVPVLSGLSTSDRVCVAGPELLNDHEI